MKTAPNRPVVLSLLLSFVCVLAIAPQAAFAQTTYTWLNTAPDGNWTQGASGARWNPGGLFDNPGFGVLLFDNNAFPSMTNNVAGTYNMHGLVFGSSATTARTLTGNTMRLFDNGGADPKIINDSSATHVINFNLEGDGDAGDPLKVTLNSSGGLTFGGTINNQDSFIDVVGSTSTAGVTATFNGVISGGGGLYKTNANTVVTLNNANTYSGGTIVDAGTLRIGTNFATNGSGTLVSGALGTGNLTLADGVTITAVGSTTRTNATPVTTLNGNITIGAASGDTGILRLASAWNLNGGTRTITLARTSTGYANGLESVSFISNTVASVVFSNGGSLILATTSGTTNQAAVTRVSQASFLGNAGLTIGDGVAVVGLNGSIFGTGTSAPALTLQADSTRGGGILELGDGGSAVRNAEVFSLSGGGRVSAAQTTAATTGTLTINNGNGANFSGRILESTNAVIAVIKSGGGTQTFSGSNNYTGLTTITNGALTAANANALGSTTAGTTVGAGGALQLSGGLSFAAESLTLNGDGIAAGGSLRNLSGNNTWSGSISNNSGARINSDGGTLTISGNINSLTTQSLFIGGAGNTTIDGLLTAALTTGNGALYKDGAGVLTLSANNSGLTGLVRLLGGTISLTNLNSLGSGTLELGATTTQGVLLVNSNSSRSQNLLITDGTTNSVINLAAGQILTNSGNVIGGGNNATKFGKAGAGTLLLSGTASTYGGQIQIGGGTVVIGSTGAFGTNITTTTRGIDLGLNINDVNESNNVALLLSNGVTLSNSIYVSPNTVSGTNYTRTIGIAGTGGATINNQIFLDGNLTTDAGASSTLTLSGNLTNTGGVIKTGAGTLVLSAANTFTGKTVIGGGTVSISAENRLGATPGAFTNDMLTLSNGGKLLTTSGFTFSTNRGITLGTGGGVFEVATGQTLIITNNTNGQPGMIVGLGSLTKLGGGVLSLRGSNTFSGGLVLGEGTLQVGSSTINSGATLVAGALGTGNLTLSNGVTIQGNGGNSVYATNIFVNGDFAVNTNVRSAAGNGRLTLGGNINLGGATRTITVGAWTNAAGAIQGGIESLRLGNNSDFNANYTNGSLRFVRDGAGTASDFVAVNFTTAGQTFSGGGGFVIGTNVITTFASGSAFTNAAGALPTVTLEAGGYFNLGTSNGVNNQTIRSLAGTNGYVTSLANAAATNTAFLTISNQAGDNSTFAGQIVNGNTLNASLGTQATNVALGLIKNGAGTQVLSGTNTHAGSTTISAGVLTFANTNAKSVNSQVTVQSNAVIGLGVGGAGGYDEATITSIISNTATGYTMNIGSIVGIDTTGGNFSYGTGIANTRELWKLGANTLTLTAGSGRTGATAVTGGTLELNATSGQAAGGTTNISVLSGATLLISKSDQVNNSATITLSGGTIQRGSGVSEVMGNLNLTAASFLDYGTGTSGTLSFGTYSPSLKLTVNNFLVGNVLTFGSDLTSSVNNTSLFAFDNDFTSGWDSGSSTFTITAIPEPSTVLAAIGLLGLCLWPMRRRLARWSKAASH